MKVHAATPNGIVQTFCRMCDTRCAIDVHVKDSTISEITPTEGHPVNQGRMCPRGGAAIDLFYHPDRILKPLKRQPDGSFTKIPYQQALGEISAKLQTLKSKYGAHAVGAWKGEGLGFHQQEGYIRRFVQAFGSPNYFSNDSACYNGRYLGYHLVCGFWNGFPKFDQAKLILLFGTNPPMCHPPFMREFADARENGAKLVVIDPRLNPVACYADIFAQPYPGTDGALGWGLINYLVQSRQYDSDLVEHHSVGFEKIVAYARKFTPQYVQEQTGVYAHVVEEIAQLIIKNRPHISIFPGTGLEHHENGVNSVRTLAILSCLSGALGRPCGLFQPATFEIRKLTLDREQLLVTPKPIGADNFPVLYDIRKECHSMTAMDYMLGTGAYPLKGLIVSAANPAVTNPNTTKVENALKRLDLLVVTDFFITKTARLAHYILPAATFLEREELHIFFKHQTANISQRVATVDGILDEYQIWRELALRLGFGERYFSWKNEDEVNQWLLEPTGVTVEFLRDHPRGFVYKPVSYQKDIVENLPTPTGKLEFASQYLKQYGLDEIPEYTPPFHRRKGSARFPFVLTTGARKSLFYHSRHQNIPRFRNVHPEAEMEIHPEDATMLQITDGEKVCVISEIGRLTIRAAIKHHSELRRGVVEIYHGWENWRVNFLTHDEVNDPISGFPLLKAVPVRIEKLSP